MKQPGPKTDVLGAMRHRISIRQYSAARDAAGGETLTWSELAEVWAAIEWKTASGEVEQSTRVTAQEVVVFTIYYRTDIDEKMRILWNSKLWNIHSILPDNRLLFTEIEAEHYTT